MPPPRQILNNEIFQVMLQTTDGGAIYTYGTDGTGSRIAYNEIFDIHAGGYHAVGIYLDNYDSNYLVDHNLAFDNDIGIKLNPPSTNERIYNNTFADNTWDINSSGSLNMAARCSRTTSSPTRCIYGSNATLIDNIYKGTNPDFVGAATGNSLCGRVAGDRQRRKPGIGHRRVRGAAPDIGALEFSGEAVKYGSVGVGSTGTVITPPRRHNHLAPSHPEDHHAGRRTAADQHTRTATPSRRRRRTPDPERRTAGAGPTPWYTATRPPRPP